jgi:hypothetical protein
LRFSAEQQQADPEVDLGALRAKEMIHRLKTRDLRKLGSRLPIPSFLGRHVPRRIDDRIQVR